MWWAQSSNQSPHLPFLYCCWCFPTLGSLQKSLPSSKMAWHWGGGVWARISSVRSALVRRSKLFGQGTPSGKARGFLVLGFSSFGSDLVPMPLGMETDSRGVWVLGFGFGVAFISSKADPLFSC